jgi:hypothetical protein
MTTTHAHVVQELSNNHLHGWADTMHTIQLCGSIARKSSTHVKGVDHLVALGFHDLGYAED